MRMSIFRRIYSLLMPRRGVKQCAPVKPFTRRPRSEIEFIGFVSEEECLAKNKCQQEPNFEEFRGVLCRELLWMPEQESKKVGG